MSAFVETALFYGTVIFQILCWLYIIGPLLLVAPAFQISYLGVDIRHAETLKEKLKYHAMRVLMWFLIGVWVAGLIGIVLYHGGALQWLI